MRAEVGLVSDTEQAMKMRYLAMVSAAALLAACGGEDADETIESDAPSQASGDVEAVDEAADDEDDAGESQADPAPEPEASDRAGDDADEGDDADPAPEEGSLEWALQGDWRGGDAARDEWRHPQATLEFFQIDASGVVVEVWPGAGWYSAILAPWVSANDGRFVAAHFPTEGSERAQEMVAAYADRFSDPVFGEILMTEFGPESGPLVDPGMADAVLTFRNVHNWMGRGYVEKAFADFYTALRPGGVLGVVEHRLPASQEQDPSAASGYVQQDYVISLAQEAGFELVATSEINANPDDDADHPFGVWTLPPVARTAPFGQEADPGFDRAPYDAIGESDRMTLLFRKPETEAGGNGDAANDAEE